MIGGRREAGRTRLAALVACVTATLGSPSLAQDEGAASPAPAPAAPPAAQSSEQPAAWTPPASGTTVRVSLGEGGAELAAGANFSVLSADGTCVAFLADLPGVRSEAGLPVASAWRRDLDTGRVSFVPPEIEGRRFFGALPALSADGARIAVGTTRGAEVRAIEFSGVMVVDADGAPLAFADGARKGVDGPVAWGKPLAFSADGGTLVFQTNADPEHGLRAGARLMDVDEDEVGPLPCGAQDMWVVGAAVSGDGRRIAVMHLGVRGADPRQGGLYVLDRDTGKATAVAASPEGAPVGAFSPSLSLDGRWLVYAAFDVPGIEGDDNEARDVFRYDVETRTVTLVSVTPDGAVGNAGSDSWGGAAVSADGRYVAFTSDADDLVPDDGNGLRDVFVRDMVRGRTVRVSVARDGGDADGASSWPSLSADGRRIAFTSEAGHLVEGDGNGAPDVFVRALAWED